MSIIRECYFGATLNHQKHTNETYKQCVVARRNNFVKMSVSFEMKEEYFDVEQPHFKPTKNEVRISKNLRKRKRKIERNVGEIKAEIFHKKIELRLKISFHSLLNLHKSEIKYINETSVPNHTGNEQILLYEEGLIVNKSSCPLLTRLDGEEYLIPANCRFLQSDYSEIDALLNDCVVNGCYDVIVMDPPWENKSAKRGRQYNWLSTNQILQIQISKLLSHNGYLAVWVTNKQKLRDFVINEFFPGNSVQFITTWFWVKTTQGFEPVISFDSTHKKPYEILIIGKRVSPTFQHQIIANSLVFCSVPCTVHSHKPPVDKLVRKYLIPHLHSPKCLEMFARNLLPNWTSWGNEVLNMQNVKYYDKIA